MEALRQEEADIYETLELGGEENERKRQSVENLEAVIRTWKRMNQGEGSDGELAECEG